MTTGDISIFVMLLYPASNICYERIEFPHPTMSMEAVLGKEYRLVNAYSNSGYSTYQSNTMSVD